MKRARVPTGKDALTCRIFDVCFAPHSEHSAEIAERLKADSPKQAKRIFCSCYLARQKWDGGLQNNASMSFRCSLCFVGLLSLSF